MLRTGKESFGGGLNIDRKLRRRRLETLLEARLSTKDRLEGGEPPVYGGFFAW